MDAKEAIEWLTAIDKKYIHGGDESYDQKRREAIQTAILALEKQVPKKPIVENLGTNYSFWYLCPQCNRKLINNIDGSWVAGMKYKHCPDCGQKIDWSE